MDSEGSWRRQETVNETDRQKGGLVSFVNRSANKVGRSHGKGTFLYRIAENPGGPSVCFGRKEVEGGLSPPSTDTFRSTGSPLPIPLPPDSDFLGQDTAVL